MSSAKQINFYRKLLELQNDYNNGNEKPFEDLVKANTFMLLKSSLYSFLLIKPSSSTR